MPRLLTTRNLLDKRPGKIVQFDDEIFSEAIGSAELKGAWLIYGNEKNGKTWLTLKLVKSLSKFHKVAYISAEEGTDKSFQDACNRAEVSNADKILWGEYLSLEEIVTEFSKPKTANIIVIDNMTIYPDEFKTMGVREFINALPNKLIIFIAHEERKEAYPACAKMAKKLAKVIINVKGLRAFVVSRFSKGGAIDINEEMSEMYWGG